MHVIGRCQQLSNKLPCSRSMPQPAISVTFSDSCSPATAYTCLIQPSHRSSLTSGLTCSLLLLQVAMDKIIPSSPSTPISPQSSSSTPRSSIGSDAAISHRNAVAADLMPGRSSPSTSAEPLSESVLEVMPPTAIADDAFSEVRFHGRSVRFWSCM